MEDKERELVYSMCRLFGFFEVYRNGVLVGVWVLKDGKFIKQQYMNVFQKTYKRWFGILTLQECFDLSLSHIENIYGDEINKLNCRSIWVDSKGKKYRCESLYHK